MNLASLKSVEVWGRGLLAAAVSGGSGGVLTGFAAIGLDPQHFNLNEGIGHAYKIALAGAVINAFIGVATYLQKSPLPEPWDGNDRRGTRPAGVTSPDAH